MTTARHRLALPPGFKLGRYRLQSVLGSGGFGITYLAQDETLKRRVAIKELLPNDIATRVDGRSVVAKTESEEKSLGWARERFMDEGRALAACDHPNVVNVYEMVEANGTAYMVTKYEEGRSLEQWLQELGRRPNESELRSVLIPLLSGLETVHRAGFLHRDIKPENIYITKNGRPVLLDFGSARQAISNRSLAMTSIVTSGYAPFEQYHDDGKQGPWSDIYAVSGVIYRAIVGKKPPDATRRLKDDPCETLATRYAGQYGSRFLEAIDSGLAVDEAKRPQSVVDWRKMFTEQEGTNPDDTETRVLPRTVRLGATSTPPPLPTPALSSAPMASTSATFVDLIVAGKWQEALRHRRMLDVALPAAVIMLLAVIWGASRLIPHRQIKAPSSSLHLGLVSLLPDSAPNEHPSTPAVTPAPGVQPNAAPDGESALPSAAPGQQGAATLDPRLVGTWESGGHGRGQRQRWEQFADGHYTFSGPVSDTGVMSAADGRMKQYSNASQHPIDITYQFNGPKLVATTGDSSIEWTRVAESSRHQSGAPARREKTARPDVGRDLLNRALHRHGFP
ncbi:MAG TPA: serine/threonine-protein kinase [Chthoniobacterales bacterium]|jgi:serine/threonine protein kinase|nr:serine/threonine-protein kinase [Chthoniobacterales bacterium]